MKVADEYVVVGFYSILISSILFNSVKNGGGIQLIASQSPQTASTLSLFANFDAKTAKLIHNAYY